MAQRVIPPEMLLPGYRAALAKHSREARDIVADRRGPVSCKSGCAYCCYPKVVITLAEGALIYLYLKGEGLWSKELEQRLIALDLEQTATNHFDWLTYRRPCPMLLEESFGQGRCMVYPARPMTCAVSFSSDVPIKCFEHKSPMLSVASDTAIHELGGVLSYISWSLLGTDNDFSTLPGAVVFSAAKLQERESPNIFVYASIDFALNGATGFDKAGAEFVKKTK